MPAPSASRPSPSSKLIRSGLQIEVAQIPCRIECEDELFIQLLNFRYKGFSTRKDPFFSLSVEIDRTCPVDSELALALRPHGSEVSYINGQIIMEGTDFKGIFDPGEHKAHIRQPPLIHPFDCFLRLVHSHYLLGEGGFFLHASAVTRRGKGYVFFGPSGSGKSTVAGLSPDSCLSDELVAIKPSPGGCRVFGTPFWSGRNQGVPLCGLFRLKPAPFLRLERLSPAQSAGEIISSTELGLRTARSKESLFRCVTSVIDAVPCFDMHFLPDNSFWPLVESAVS